MSSNTGTSKFPSIVLPSIRARVHRVRFTRPKPPQSWDTFPRFFKRIFGRFGEKKTKKTKEKETPFDENETTKTPSSNDEKDDDAKAASKSSSSKEVKEKVIKEEEIGFSFPTRKNGAKNGAKRGARETRERERVSR